MGMTKGLTPSTLAKKAYEELFDVDPSAASNFEVAL